MIPYIDENSFECVIYEMEDICPKGDELKKYIYCKICNLCPICNNLEALA